MAWSSFATQATIPLPLLHITDPLAKRDCAASMTISVSDIIYDSPAIVAYRTSMPISNKVVQNIEYIHV